MKMNNAAKFVNDVGHGDLGAEVAESNETPNGTFILHCWDGRRFEVSQLEDGNCFDERTGKPCSKTEYDKLHAMTNEEYNKYQPTL